MNASAHDLRNPFAPKPRQKTKVVRSTVAVTDPQLKRVKLFASGFDMSITQFVGQALDYAMNNMTRENPTSRSR